MTSATKPPALSGAALRKLRALGHALAPVVAIGKEGVTDSLVAATNAAIATHELIKVKIHGEAPVNRHDAGIELAARTGSVLAQVIGRTLLLYRKHPKKPKIVLPSASSPSASSANPASSKRKPVQSPVKRTGNSGEDHEDNP